MIKNLIFFFAFSIAVGQNIHFSIKDEQGIIISAANALFKEKATSICLEYTKIYDGQKEYQLKNNFTHLVIEIQSTSYYAETIEIINPVKDKIYVFNVILKQNKTIQLDDVVIKIDEKPYKIKKDTLVFDVKKYRDGTERKVIDLIKKLPGVEVGTNGSIKYNGKPLETVTLDGDDIFNSNYQLGTKNINIDMVDQIEAIDNYTNNSLLKGIESDGKVALNLKIKKGKSDFSGDLENSLGLKNDLKSAFYSNSYLMQISSKMKSFTTLNFNNIGRSDAYFYEKQSSKSLDKKLDIDFETKKLILDGLYVPELSEIRTNRNSQLFISHNNLYKLTPKLNLKTNINFIDDKIDSEQNISTTNFINNSVFETTDKFLFIKKPKVFAVELELKLNVSKSTLLEIFSKQYFEQTKLFSNYLKNNEFGYNNQNVTNSYLSINKVVHTWKISQHDALQGNIYYTFNKIPQTFISLNSNDNIIQSSEFKKTTLMTNYNLIGKAKNLSYTFQIGANFERTPYLSENTTAINDHLFLKNSFYSNSRLKIQVKKLKVVPCIGLTNYNLTLTNEASLVQSKSTNLVFEPSLSFEYRFKKGTLSALYSNSQKPLTEEYIYTNNVLINNRTTIQNQPSFDFTKTNSFGLTYFYKDLTENTTLNLATQYQKSNGQYLSSFTINEKFSTIKNQFYVAANSTINTNLKITRFFEKLSSTIGLTTDFSIHEYPNFVNSTDIRKNTNQNFKSTIELRTGFLTKLNFTEIFTFTTTESKSMVTNNIDAVQNQFKISYKISKKSRSSIQTDVFIPSIKKSTNRYNFIDIEYYYTFSEKINFIFVANNLLNLQTFNQAETNDFSSFVSQTNLTQRYFLFNVEYHF